MQQSDPSPNPYAAPQAPLTPYADTNTTAMQQANGQWYYSAWPLMFLFNLLAPMMLGMWQCSNSGRIAVALVNVGLLVTTTYFVSRDPLLRSRWLTGSFVVGMLQFFPIIHIILGMVSVNLLVRAGLVNDLTDPENLDPFPNFAPIEFWPACLLTLMVGGGLLSLAFLIGWMIPHRTREISKKATS